MDTRHSIEEEFLSVASSCFVARLTQVRAGGDRMHVLGRCYGK